jgi:hypothetical protein
MRICDVSYAGAIFALLLAVSSQASAQTFESVGVRAQGLGGAFVAVADDATASWWNPAGLATGAYLSAVIEHGQTTEPDNPPASGPARRTTPTSIAVSIPSFGFSYYTMHISEIAGAGSTAGAAANRQDPGAAGTSVRSVALTQYGATFGQSIGSALVIGTTWKLMRAGAVNAVTTAPVSLDTADDVDVPRSTRVDFDLGVLARIGHLRLGGTVKNITRPSFGDASPLILSREVRVGGAWFTQAVGGMRGIVVAGDADLTSTPTVLGDVRHIAGGVEGWLAKGRVGLRGGVSGNTVGASRPAASGGFSLGLTHALHVNASRTIGRDSSLTGWGLSLSATF